MFRKIGWMFLVIITLSCNKETIIGTEIVSGEDAEIEFIDTVSIRAKTVSIDSILTGLRSSTGARTFMVGEMDDPFFGKTTASVYLNAGISGNAILPSFENTSLDSIFLVLQLDTFGIYGNEDAVFDIEVFRMRENIMDIDSIFSNDSFLTDMNPIGVLEGYQIKRNDSLSIVENGDTITVVNQIRIPLSSEFGTEILMQGNDLTTDTIFSELVNGFYVTASTSDNALFGLNLSVAARSARDAELAVYYSQTDMSESAKYGFLAGLVKSNHFEHDLSSVSLADYFGDYDKGEELLFIQSLAGPNIEFDLSNVISQRGKLLNHASIELVTASDLMDNDEEQFRPIDFLVSSEFDEDGDLIVTGDINALLGLAEAVSSFEEDGMKFYKYEIPVTHFVKDILNDVSNDKILTLSTFSKSQNPRRSIIYGPQSSKHPSKLKLIFTNP